MTWPMLSWLRAGAPPPPPHAPVVVHPRRRSPPPPLPSRHKLSPPSPAISRRDYLRNHPEDATTEEKLEQAREEIKSLLAVKQPPASASSESQLPPVDMLISAADEERALSMTRGGRSCAGRGGAVLEPVGAQWDKVRADGGPPVANISELFRVVHCRVDGRERFEITRQQQCRAPRQLTTNTSSLAIFVRDFGPDELVVLLEGPELLPCDVHYLGACTYAATCEPVTVAGGYHLSALHLRSSYDALDELLRRWPPMQFDKLVGDDFVLELPVSDVGAMTGYGATSGGAMPGHGSVVGGRGGVGGHGGTGGRYGVGRHESMWPMCDEACGRSAANGRWVNAAHVYDRGGEVATSDLAPRVTRRGTIDRMDIPMRGSWVNTSDYMWVPRTCTLSRYTADSVSAQLSRANVTSIHIVGDSHAATLYMQMIERLGWPVEPCEQRPTGCTYMKGSRSNFTDQTVTTSKHGVRAYKQYYSSRKYHHRVRATTALMMAA